METTTFVITFLTLAATVRAQTTAKMFIPIPNAQSVVWDASVIGACADSTTYALRCTESPLPPTLANSLKAVYSSQVASFCDSGGPIQTVTAGPSGFYETAEVTMADGLTFMGTVSCDLSGTTRAVCSRTLAADTGSTSTETAFATTLTGAQVPFVDVTITGGSEILAKATGKTCVSSGAGLSASLALTAAAFVFGVSAVFGL